MCASRLTEILESLNREFLGEEDSPAPETIPATAIPDRYLFGEDNRYGITVANDRRTRWTAWNMVYRAYLEIRYVNRDPSGLRMVLQDASPATTSFLVEEGPGSAPKATFTLTPDSPLGLPLENYFPAEVRSLRQSGRKPCEISKLVACPLAAADQPGMEILLNAFKLAYLTARRLENCTDFVIAVVPRHVFYYRRMLMFEPLGEARRYRSLNGLETVPLRLDLTTVEERYRKRFDCLPKPRNLYRFFINDQEASILDWLRQQRRPMSENDFRYFFQEESNLYDKASPEDRLFLQSCYLPFDVEPSMVAGGVEI